MTYQFTISTDNAAFEDPWELSRILRELADAAQAQGGQFADGTCIRDTNGNQVGRVFAFTVSPVKSATG